MERSTPRGKWKSRFGLGRRTSQKNKILLAGGPEEPDNGEARNLTAKRNQRVGGKGDKKQQQKGGNRKLNIKTDFRKESRDASDTSNPQSPYSNDSYLAAEVSSSDWWMRKSCGASADYSSHDYHLNTLSVFLFQFW
jgi:hypothetical protein